MYRQQVYMLKKANQIFNMVHIILSCLMLIIIGSSSQPQTLSQSDCSYTFMVPRQVDKCCTVGSVASELEDLKSQLKLVTQNQQNLQEKVQAIEEVKPARVGTNYVRWGRRVCPQTAQLIYEGLKIS